MNIIINSKNVLDEANGLFLTENPSAKGLPPAGLQVQYMNEAVGRVAMILDRFYAPIEQTEASNELWLPEEFVFEVKLTSRRAAGKLQPLTDAIHSFMVNSILMRVFANNGLKELSEQHRVLMVDDASVINKLIHSKRPPKC